MPRFTNPNPEPARIQTTIQATHHNGARSGRSGKHHRRNSLFLAAALLLSAAPSLFAQNPPTAPQKGPPLTVDHDPVRSPDPDEPHNAKTDTVVKETGGYVLRSDVEEVSLNVTVLDNSGHLVQDLKRDDFKVQEDGVAQKLLSFQHADIPVSIGLVIDNPVRCTRSVPR